MSIILNVVAIILAPIGFLLRGSTSGFAIAVVSMAFAVVGLAFLGLSYLVNWKRGCDNHLLSPKDDCAFCKLQKTYRE